MSFIAPAAGQTGVPRLELVVPTFNKYTFQASTVSVEDGTTREPYENATGETATHGQTNPMLTISGTMLLATNADVPRKGDVMKPKNSSGFFQNKFLEVAESNVTGLVNGRPAAVSITLEFWPAKNTYWTSNAPTDLDASGS
jgi:hypothetical protein